MNNSLSAHRQVLIKKSGKTIEDLAPNSERVAFFFKVPRDPLPAVRWDKRVSVGVLEVSPRGQQWRSKTFY